MLSVCWVKKSTGMRVLQLTWHLTLKLLYYSRAPVWTESNTLKACQDRHGVRLVPICLLVRHARESWCSYDPVELWRHLRKTSARRRLSALAPPPAQLDRVFTSNLKEGRPPKKRISLKTFSFAEFKRLMLAESITKSATVFFQRHKVPSFAADLSFEGSIQIWKFMSFVMKAFKRQKPAINFRFQELSAAEC